MAIPKQHLPALSTPPLTFLFLLRSFCALHLVISTFTTPTASLFHALAPIQIPFLLFLSGFTTTYTNALPHRRRLFNPTLFHIRRFAQLVPLYLLALLLHLPFSQSTHSIVRAVFAALGLSPYVPRSLTFPPDDAPIPGINFLPALFLCYLIFPVLLDVFPRYDTSTPHHLTLTLVGAWLLTIAQSYWLSHLPETAESSRDIMVIDFAVYVPFLAHVLSFICGMLLALRFLSIKHATVPIAKRLISAMVAIAVFFVFAVFVLPFRLDMPKEDGARSFMSNWALCSALIPVFGAMVWTLAALDVPPEGRAKGLGMTIEYGGLTCLAAFSYTMYAVSVPVWRSLGFALCRRTGANGIALRHLVCLSRSNACSTMPSSSPWWWPWGGRSDLSWISTSAAAASRVTTPSSVLGPAVHPLIYVPVLIGVSGVVYAGVQRPLAIMIVTTYERLMAMASDGTAAHSALLSRLSVLLAEEGDYAKPRRNNSNAERFLRVIVYYVASSGFLAFMFRYSMPMLFHNKASNPKTLLCWMPGTPCDLIRESAGLLGQLGIRSRIVTAVVDVVRWLSFLTLPTLLVNVVGHAIFPRAIWRRLPTLAQMVEASATDEALSLAENGTSVTQQNAEGSNTPRNDEISSAQWACAQKLDLDFIIFMRYVTRGKSPRLVANNAKRAMEILTKCGLPREMWRVEVVTDESLDLDGEISDPSVYEIVVPDSYKPPNGALYKARALNYAISASPARPQDWIVHLDEETRFDSDTIRAIVYHCGRESYLTRIANSQEWPRIGQGPILYGRAMTDASIAGSDVGNGNWITTLADSGRVSDDCGRYRIQYECGEVWVGMHGSFVVAANCVEQEITFDHGVEGSIAEDAFFALLARARNVRFAWIDGMMFEQSPFTAADFIKQRSRWLVGGLRVVSSERIPMRLRVLMKSMTYLWALMPVLYGSLFLAILFGTSDHGRSTHNHWYHNLLLPTLAAASIWNYIFGFFVTFSVRHLGIVRFATLLYLQLVLTPIFGVMEVASVSYALFNYANLSVKFHIVEKDKPQQQETKDESTSLL